MTAPTAQAPHRGAGAPPAVDDAPGAAGQGSTRPQVVGSLSPSRAGDFLTCPLLFRFRTIDRLPEPPSPAAARGTLVHATLEALFDLPAQERTPDAAAALLEPAWRQMLDDEPAMADLFPDAAELGEWLASARALVDAYFELEDPRQLEPAAREQLVEVLLPGGLRLRGIVDRLDVANDGALRLVDYKTSRAPSELFEARALFQMKFYGLVLWRTRGVLPRMLQLMYLGDREVLRYAPDEADLLAVERKLLAVWAAVERAIRLREFRPRPGRLCDWCAHRALCPEFGGTPPPWPEALPAPDELLPHQQRRAEARVPAPDQ